jgi:hypothetical protein
VPRTKGTPPGGVGRPGLAQLFVPSMFDVGMPRTCPGMTWGRDPRTGAGRESPRPRRTSSRRRGQHGLRSAVWHGLQTQPGLLMARIEGGQGRSRTRRLTASVPPCGPEWCSSATATGGGVGELSSGGARRQAAAPSAAHLAPPDSPAPGRYGAIPLPCAAGRGGRRAVLSVSEGAGAAACQPDVEGVGEAEVPAAQGTQGADGPLERRQREAATAVVCTLAARDGGRMCLMGAV